MRLKGIWNYSVNLHKLLASDWFINNGTEKCIIWSKNILKEIRNTTSVAAISQLLQHFQRKISYRSHQLDSFLLSLTKQWNQKRLLMNLPACTYKTITLSTGNQLGSILVTTWKIYLNWTSLSSIYQYDKVKIILKFKAIDLLLLGLISRQEICQQHNLIESKDLNDYT